MSKVGKLPVAIPAGVTVNVADGVIAVKGPKGELKQTFHNEIDIKVEGTEVILTPKDSSKQTNAYHGLYRSLINNMVKGVTEGFSKTLIVTGVGFRAEVKGKELVMNLGYSSDFIAIIPDGLTVTATPDGKVQLPVSTSSWLVNLVLRLASCASLNLTRERVYATKTKLSAARLVRLVLNKVKLYV